MIKWGLLAFCCLCLALPACEEPGAGDGQLTVVFPLETTELAGLQSSLRVTLHLQDRDGQPVEGATVEVQLVAPDGSTFATPPCAEASPGRYQADYVQLPTRGTEGTWRVTARASWGDDQQAQAERPFKGLPSLSEELQREYGFWVDVPAPRGFGYDKLWHYAQRYDDGSGYVFIDNRGHGTVRVDVHWRHVDFPADAAAACAYVRDLPLSAEAEHILDPNLAAEQTTFQGKSVWLVTGRTLSGHGYTALGGDIEWVILQCPDSPWLWTLAIHTSNPSNEEHLRQTRETFQCP
ncbi:MAG: hypothetical protein KKA73_11490 [Chloroflexi bacterium]|nr:hypothetical protein [Chloroflexota bacterium]MBU1748302.1 hypothetical protein [Chloroflexota bacterium]MBU1879388.1 hypothetical protein [Chloroflexota bacterium]